MVNIPQEMKDRLKQQRLDQYRAQIYNLQMDLAAYQAISDDQMIKHTEDAIASGKSAYAAVEAME